MNHRPATWNEYLVTLDTDKIWKELHRIIAQHKLSRYSTKYDQLRQEHEFNHYTDLTQDLFLKLLEKNRFKHYIDTKMSDAEIEMEISQIELTNILTLELRKRYPEAYRISRRILQILQNDTVFKRYDTQQYKRISNQVYGLCKWPHEKEIGLLCNFEQNLGLVPHYTRDIRHAGCAGDSQIIISNDLLKNLIILVFKALDSPLTVMQIRKYVMSKLTIMDISITPIEAFNIDEDKAIYEIADIRDNPEQHILKASLESDAESKVDEFLTSIWNASKQKHKQYHLMLNILRLYYLTPDLSQWDVSKQLNVSDSLISGYRKIIDIILQNLGFTTIEEAKRFKSALNLYLKNNVKI